MAPSRWGGDTQGPPWWLGTAHGIEYAAELGDRAVPVLVPGRTGQRGVPVPSYGFLAGHGVSV
jgi:hypothetical protein